MLIAITLLAANVSAPADMAGANIAIKLVNKPRGVIEKLLPLPLVKVTAT